MNRIFKKVWNKALGRLVVASELASGDSGGAVSGATRSASAAQPAALSVALTFALASMGAYAQSTQENWGPDGELIIGQTVLDSSGLQVGSDVAIGVNAIRAGTVQMRSATNDLVGLSNRSWNTSGTYNAGRAATEEQLKVVSDAAQAASAGITVRANGAGGGVNVGPGGSLSVNSGSNLTVTQGGSANNATLSVALNQNVVLAPTGSIAVGATTVNNAGVLVGTTTLLSSNGLTLIGGGPSVTTGGINAGNTKITNLAAGSATAGSKDAVTGDQLYTLEQRLYNSGDGTRYFRVNAGSTNAEASTAVADASIAIGPGTVTSGTNSIAAGHQASTGITASSAIAVGRSATTEAARSIVLGDEANGGTQFVADTIVVGTKASVTGNFSSGAVVIGNEATASAAGAVALGEDSEASGAGAAALGQGATASAANALAVGTATASAANAFAAGNGAVAATADSIALGVGAGVGTLPGNNAGDRTSHVAIGTGAGVNVVGNQSTAIGYKAGNDVEGDQNIAIGSEAGTAVDGDYNIAIGFKANANRGAVNNATAIGRESQAGTDAAALGADAKALGTGSVAVGLNSQAGNLATAVGRNAFAADNNVALGDGSRAQASDYTGAGYLTGSPVVAGGSIVSVGNSSNGATRRIVNVADGAQAHDAVNVGQLRASQEKLATFVGGNVTVDANGSYSQITLTDSGGTTHSFATLTEAMGALTGGQIDVTAPDAVRFNGAGQISNVADATLGDQAVNLSQMEQSIADNKSQYFSVNSTTGGNQNNKGATGDDAIAIGRDASASGIQSTALGYDAHANADGGLAIGRDVDARGLNSTVLGNSGAYANDAGGVSIGQNARSTGLNSITIGTNAQADPKTSSNSVDNAIVMGTDAEVTADDGVAIGHSALARELRGVAQGFQAQSLAVDAIAQGSNATANGVSSQASGTNAVSNGENSQASGTDSVANGSNSIASGTGAVAHAADSIAMGTGAVTGLATNDPIEALRNFNSIAIGNSSLADRIDATAVGNNAHATGDAASAFGNQSRANGARSLAAGDQADANGSDAVAVGSSAQGGGRNAVAVGASSNASGDEATAIGNSAQATTGDTIAIGNGATASAGRALAMGAASVASNAHATAVGTRARALGANSAALGYNAEASGANATALGNSTNAAHANSVALGNGSATAAPVTTASLMIDGNTYNYAGGTPIGTVSIGTAGQTRTITNVAAGRVSATSTDAINGSQLYGTNVALQALAGNLDTAGTSVANALGGNYSYSPTTHRVTGGMTVGAVTNGTVQQAITEAASGFALTTGKEVSSRSQVGVNSPTGAQMDLSASNNNLSVQKSASSNDVVFALSNDLDLSDSGSLTIGGSTITDGEVNVSGPMGQTSLGGGIAFISNGTAASVVAPGAISLFDGSRQSFLNTTTLALGGDNPVNVDGQAGTVTGLSNRTYTPGTFVSGRAATEDQLEQLNNTVNAGWNVTDATGNDANIGPNGQVRFTGNDNINVAQTGTDDDGEIAITLADNIDLGSAGSLTTGNTVVNNAGVTVANTITGSSTVGAGSIALGDTAGNTTMLGATSISVGGGSTPVVINGAAGTIGGLTNVTFDPTQVNSGQAATEDQLKQVSDVANAGWNIGDGKTSSNVAPGASVAFTGDSNISVSHNTDLNGNVEMAVTLADNIDLGSSGSVTTGNTVVNNDGVSVGNSITGGSTAVGGGSIGLGDSAGNLTSLGATSISVGGRASPVLIDGAAGTIGGLSNVTFDPTQVNSGQAATEDQLKQVSDVANAGWNIGDGNTSSNVAPGASVAFTGDSNVSVTHSTNLNGDVEMAVALADNIDLGSAGSVTTGNTVVNNDGVTVGDTTTGGSTAVGAGSITLGDVAGNTTTLGATSISVGGGATPVVINGATGTIGGLTNVTFDPTKVNSGQAATEDQLKQVSDVASAGWNIGDGSTSSNVAPGASVAFTGDSNVSVTHSTDLNGNVEMAVTLADNIDLGNTGSVTTGNTVVNNAGVTVADTTTGGSTTVGAGSIALGDAAGNTTTLGATSISVGGGATPVVINGAAGTIGGLTNTTYNANTVVSGQAATEDQLKQVSDQANAGWTVSAEGSNASNVGVSSSTGNSMDLRSADGNVVVSKAANSNDVEFGLADDVNIAGSVTVGNTSLTGNGMTIVGGPSITTAGIDAGGKRLSGVATGVDGTDAVNVDQLDATIEARRTRYYSVNSTGGGNEDNDGATGDDAIASGRNAKAEGDEALAMGLAASAAGNGSVALGSGAQALQANSLALGPGAVSNHANSVALGAGSATTVGAQTSYQGAYVGTSSSTGEMNVGGRQLTGIAAGSADNDAVNVNQLKTGVASAVSEANQYTDTQIGAVNTRIDGIDTRLTTVEGDIIDIRGDITDIRNDVVDIQGDITDLDGRLGTVEGDLAHANQTAIATAGKVNSIENGSAGMFQVDQSGEMNQPVASGSNSAAGGKNAVASGSNSTALGNDAVASGANSTAIGQGAVASHNNSVALGQGSATTVGAQTGYNAAYVGSSSSTGEVNIGGRTLTGLAPGIAGTDATNVNQLNAGVSQAITSANQYTDARIGKVESDMWQMNREYRSATAAAMAMAGLPQAYLPGKSMLSMAFGGYQSEYGMALGLSGITDNGRWIYKAQASGNTTREWGFSVGAGIQW